MRFISVARSLMLPLVLMAASSSLSAQIRVSVRAARPPDL
jgi:hypothetical protein